MTVRRRHYDARNMLAFMFKIWGLAKPYRLRLQLGVLAGVVNGLVSPLLIGIVMFVYGAIFPAQDGGGAPQLPLHHTPAFIVAWFKQVRIALEGGVHEHPW